MWQRFPLVGLLFLATALAGCGGVKPVTGGTQGTLKVGGQLLSDIQVTVHRVDGDTIESIGFGTTDNDGVFELVTNGAKGPLWLEEGEYRFTLESAGAPVQFSPEYALPTKTPLRVSWAGSEQDLELTASLAEAP